MSSAFLAAVANRRTYYGLSKKTTIPAAKIKEIVYELVKNVPSAFNTQTSRVVILFGAESDKLWKDVIEPTYLEIVSDESAKQAAIQKCSGYAAGYGTIVFFEETAIVKSWQEKMPPMANCFPEWSEVASGMLQMSVWTALEAEGLGANLQHYALYSPSTNPAILKAFGLPETWKSTAQMPFGVPVGGPGGTHVKTFDLMEERVKVIGDAA